jgi:hypothetical protein
MFEFLKKDLRMPIRLDGKVLFEALLPSWFDDKATFAQTKLKEKDGLPQIFIAHPKHLPMKLNKQTRRFENVTPLEIPMEVLKGIPEIKREVIKI